MSFCRILPDISTRSDPVTSGKNQSRIESPLTPKEKEIVVGLVDVLHHKMIADRMDISRNTIRFHIKNIYKKPHVASKAEVISKSSRGRYEREALDWRSDGVRIGYFIKGFTTTATRN